MFTGANAWIQLPKIFLLCMSMVQSLYFKVTGKPDCFPIPRPITFQKACFILGNQSKSLSKVFTLFSEIQMLFSCGLARDFLTHFILILALCFRVGVLHLWFLFWKKAKLCIVWLCTSKGNTDSCLLDPFLSKPEECISFDQEDVFFIPHTFLDNLKRKITVLISIVHACHGQRRW